jgi:hypothetical protein
LAELPRSHPFREIVTTPASFSSDLAGELPPFALARLHGAWTRGVEALDGGEDELVDFLLERIRAHGGDTRLADRAASIVHKGGKVRGVQVDGDDAPVGVTFVVSDLPSSELLELARPVDPAFNVHDAFVESREHRFVLSLAVRSEGVPANLAQNSFLRPAKGGTIHVERARARDASDATALLVAETIVARGASVANTREDVLGTLFEFFPFLERHLLVCDSPHDGRPLWDFRTASARPHELPRVGPTSWGLRARYIERALVRASTGASPPQRETTAVSLEPEPMQPRFVVTEPQALFGLAGEPLRTKLGCAFVTGRTTLPALGQEGQLLAAWSVARIITRTSRRKEKMLREMWNKVELS